MIVYVDDTHLVDTIRIIEKGDKWGRNNVLTYDKDHPMIQFCQGDFMISSYYLSTFMEIKDNGLCLDGGMRKYDQSAVRIRQLQNFVRLVERDEWDCSTI